MSGLIGLIGFYPFLFGCGWVWGYFCGGDIAVWNFWEAMSCDYLAKQEGCQSKNKALGILIIVLNFIFPVQPGRYVGGYTYLNWYTINKKYVNLPLLKQDWENKRREKLAKMYPDKFGQDNIVSNLGEKLKDKIDTIVVNQS